VTHPCNVIPCEQEIVDACNALYQVAGDPSTISVNPLMDNGWANGITCEAVHNADPNTDQDCCGNACVSATTTTTACPNPPCCPSEYEGNPCLGGNVVKFLGVFGEGCWDGASVVINGVTSENYETIRLSDGTCISSWVPVDGFSGATKTVDEVWAGHTCADLADPAQYGGDATLVDCPAGGGGGGGGDPPADQWYCNTVGFGCPAPPCHQCNGGAAGSPEAVAAEAMAGGDGCWEVFPTEGECQACCPCAGATNPQNCTPATQPPRISGLWEGLS
jgi:hypothetical protein